MIKFQYKKKTDSFDIISIFKFKSKTRAAERVIVKEKTK